MSTPAAEYALPFIAAAKDKAAESVGLSPRSLDQAVEQGDLVAHYWNTKPLFLATELAEFVAALPTDKPNRATS